MGPKVQMFDLETGEPAAIDPAEVSELCGTRTKRE